MGEEGENRRLSPTANLPGGNQRAPFGGRSSHRGACHEHRGRPIRSASWGTQPHGCVSPNDAVGFRRIFRTSEPARSSSDLVRPASSGSCARKSQEDNAQIHCVAFPRSSFPARLPLWDALPSPGPVPHPTRRPHERARRTWPRPRRQTRSFFRRCAPPPDADVHTTCPQERLVAVHAI